MSRWPTVTLGDVCEFRYGKSLPASTRHAGEVPVFGSNGRVGSHTVSLTDGPTVVIGRKGSFGEVHWSPKACWPIDTTYYVDKTATSVDLRWLSFRLRGLRLTELNRAAAVPGLNRDDAYRRELLLPPLEEQRRIAAILDQADALRAKRRASLARLEALVGALFDGAFDQGSTWPTATLDEVVRDGLRNGVSPSTGGGNAGRVLTLSAVTQGGFDPSAVKDATFAGPIREGHLVRRGLILMCRGNGNRSLVGRAVHVDRDLPGTAYPDTVIAGRLLEERILPEYFLHEWESARVRRQVESVARTTNGTYKVNQQTLGAVRLRIPPVLQQEEFGRRVQTLEDARRAGVEQLALLDGLFASLQDRAFKGEL